jgi:hypothetical protein
MANELAIIEKNWLTLVDHIKEVPAPFEQTIFLTECNLAGTIEIEDVLVKTQNVDTGTELVLKRSTAEVQDERAVAVQTKGDVLLGYVPRRYSAVMARLMDAGKNLSAKVVGKELDGHWLDVKISIEMKEV